MTGGGERRGQRRSFGNALRELHYVLRTEGDTTLRSAGAIFVGIVVGCTPLYGLHFVLCVALATLLGVSRLKAYLAAHINNPFTAPLLLPIELGTGRWLHGRGWPEALRFDFRGAVIAELGLEMLVGSLVVGLVIGTVAAGLYLLVRARAPVMSEWERVCDETARRYLDAGTTHWEFVRGKLRYDPMYRDVLMSGELPSSGTLLDLGCGRGILLTLLQVSADAHARGEWPADWPAPPTGLVLEGVDRREKLVSVARNATRHRAHIAAMDLSRAPIRPARAIVLLDVLHYLSPAEQEDLASRAAAALDPGGMILIREPDASRGLRFLVTRVGERLCSMLRWETFRGLHYRSAAAWCSLLEARGLTTRVRPSWCRTPFANVLILAHRPAERAPRTVA